MHGARRIRRQSIWVSVVAVATLAASVGVADAKAPPSGGGAQFVASIAPNTSGAGASPTFTITLANHTSSTTIGSVNISSPTFTILSASTPQGTAAVVANAAQYRNVSLAPGGTLAVQLTASVPCIAGRYKMTATAKVSPTFSGPVFGQSSVGPINVTGGCSLAYLAQPANANVGETISSEPFTPGGAPISVAVLDSSGTQTSLSTGNVSIAIGSNPTGGTLSGTTSRGLSGGAATFDNLSIDTHGIGYTLIASFGSVHATSDAFTIADAGSSCTGNCTTSTTADDGTGATITNFSDSGDVFLIFGLDTLDCAGYGETTATLTFGSTGNGEKLVTLTIPADVFVRKPDVGWQVCFGTDDGATFTDQDGNTVSVGLLPECGAVGNVTPCVVNRINNPDGSFSVVFRAPAGDPKGRL